MGSLQIKAKLFKMIQSVRGTDQTSHSKKDGMKDDFFSLQALGEDLTLFA